jgi:hypothetical protein
MIKAMAHLASDRDRRRAEHEDGIAKQKKLFMEGAFAVRMDS